MGQTHCAPWLKSTSARPTKLRRTIILLFHELGDVREIGLPLRWPSHNAIKDFFTWS